MTRKICLFTAHSPLIGGGGAILRSLIENLPEIAVSWKYTAKGVALGHEQGYLGNGLMNEGLKYIWPTWQMLNEGASPRIEQLVKQLLDVDCDGYWIVSHNEGLRVALELVRKQHSRPVHLTFHDDWAGAICARSSRFRLMQGKAQKLTIAALKEVSTFDVISRGMQSYYQQLSGRKGELCHRFLPSNLVGSLGMSNEGDGSTVNIGHIGSIYSKRDFLDFLSIFHEYIRLKGQKPMLHMWGCHLKVSDIPVHLQGTVHFHMEQSEAQVIPKLARCAFVYSMYPTADALSTFSKTSLPTKLTSYLQAGCPIFGHGPSDSTLAEFLDTTGTGTLWDGRNRDAGMEALEKVFLLRPRSKQWQIAREKYFGEENLAVMRRVLANPYGEMIPAD